MLRPLAAASAFAKSKRGAVQDTTWKLRMAKFRGYG
jgi:hypothetical protein